VVELRVFTQLFAKGWVQNLFQKTMMHYVYLLQDQNKKIYIGFSSNLKRRLYEHLHNKVYTTKKMIDPKLIYYEAYNNLDAARTREKKLKQFGSSYKGLINRIELK